MVRVRHSSLAFVGMAILIGGLLAACGGAEATAGVKSSATASAKGSSAVATPRTVPQTNPAPAGGTSAQGTVAPGVPAPGPNLLAKDWPQRLGVSVSPLKPATGKPILNPKAGDLWFFSNSSTTWGATNTKNSVWVVDAKTKQTIVDAAPFDGEGASSHGIAVSGDGRFVYLPMLGKNNHVDVLDGRTLEVVQTITTIGRPHHWKLWHDPNTNKDLILGEDFNWSFSGSGIYAFDPSQENAVVGGMSLGDFEGNPYVTTPAPDGSFIVVTVPAPTPAMRDKMDGYVAKVDPKKWAVVGMTPMIDPLWAEVSLDGKYAYVTSGAEARVHKINLETMKDEGEVQTGPGPWGARISYDQTKLYTADKGEGPGYNQQGRTSTVIDLQTFGVVNVAPIGITTDHAILSPDGKEIWYTSNAEHNIYVLDTATDKISTVIKDPADGDIHGGVFVQYKDDGKGGVVGEVVADYSGLHGTALTAERQYVAQPTLAIPMDRNGFLQKSLSLQAKPGDTVRLAIKNVGGTNAGKITFQAKEMGIDAVTLDPGQTKEVNWKVPAQASSVQAQSSQKPNDTVSISVKAPQAPAAAVAPASDAPRAIALKGKGMAWDVTAITVKAGEKVQFKISNADDEKHNLVGISDGMNLIAPDVGPGQTVTYEWTAPNKAGEYKAVCAYHPQMIVTITVSP